MYTLPRNVLFNFGVPQPEIYHLGNSNCICLRGSVYFPWRIPSLLALSATSKSGKTSSAVSIPTRPQPGMEVQQTRAQTGTFALSRRSKVEGGPKTSTSQTQPALLCGKVKVSPSVCSGKRVYFSRECMCFPAGFMDHLPQCHVARVDKSDSRQTTTHSASRNVFTNLFAAFIDQATWRGIWSLVGCHTADSLAVLLLPEQS